MKLNRKQLRRLLLQEANFAMSSQDRLQSGQLEDKLEDDMSGLVSNAMALGADSKMIARVLENALAMAHMAVRGQEMDYQVEITAVHPQLGRTHRYEPSAFDDLDGDLSDEYKDMLASRPYDKS